MNNTQTLGCVGLGGGHAVGNAIPSKVAMLSLQLCHPSSNEVDKPNQSIVRVFVENLNGLISGDIERRRGTGEALPDCRSDMCGAGYSTKTGADLSTRIGTCCTTGCTGGSTNGRARFFTVIKGVDAMGITFRTMDRHITS